MKAKSEFIMYLLHLFPRATTSLHDSTSPAHTPSSQLCTDPSPHAQLVASPTHTNHPPPSPPIAPPQASASVHLIVTHSKDEANPSEADPSVSSLPLVSVAPMVLPFLYSDNSKLDNEMLERHDIPIGRLYCTHLGGPCRALTAIKLVRPLPFHRLALRYTSHHSDRFTSKSSSDHSSSDHSSSGHSTSDHSSSGHSTSDHSSSGHSTLDHSSSRHATSVHSLSGHTPLIMCHFIYFLRLFNPLNHAFMPKIVSLTIPFFIMENVNPPPTNNRPMLPVALHAQAIQELHELQRISAFGDSRLESIKRFFNNFANQPNKTNMNDLEPDDESVDTPLISPFPHLNELIDKFTAYLDHFLPMNIISRKAYDTIMVEALEGTGKNLVAIVKDVYVIFDEKKLGSSEEVLLDDSWMTI
uniref:Uncharacterized protein n=1 Tax=Tanacetum cinerariifolium TaxID=118510 RepID=A0A6L2NMN0_TANCI|nr:hypothetical protein [Tanacetum cinerariifolium]